MRHLLEILKSLTGFSHYKVRGLAGLCGGAIFYLLNAASIVYKNYKKKQIMLKQFIVKIIRFLFPSQFFLDILDARSLLVVYLFLRLYDPQYQSDPEFKLHVDDVINDLKFVEGLDDPTRGRRKSYIREWFCEYLKTLSINFIVKIVVPYYRAFYKYPSLFILGLLECALVLKYVIVWVVAYARWSYKLFKSELRAFRLSEEYMGTKEELLDFLFDVYPPLASCPDKTLLFLAILVVIVIIRCSFYLVDMFCLYYEKPESINHKIKFYLRVIFLIISMTCIILLFLKIKKYI